MVKRPPAPVFTRFDRVNAVLRLLLSTTPCRSHMTIRKSQASIGVYRCITDRLDGLSVMPFTQPRSPRKCMEVHIHPRKSRVLNRVRGRYHLRFGFSYPRSHVRRARTLSTYISMLNADRTGPVVPSLAVRTEWFVMPFRVWLLSNQRAFFLSHL